MFIRFNHVLETPTLAAGPFCWHVMAGACVDLTFIVKHCVSMFADEHAQQLKEKSGHLLIV